MNGKAFIKYNLINGWEGLCWWWDIMFIFLLAAACLGITSVCWDELADAPASTRDLSTGWINLSAASAHFRQDFVYFPPLSPLHPTSSALRAGTFARQEGRGAAGAGWLWWAGLGLECGYWKPRQEHAGKQRAQGPAAAVQGKSAGRAAPPGKEQALGLVLEY